MGEVMGRVYKKDNVIWKKNFGIILKRLFTQYELQYKLFAKEYNWSESAVRYWMCGKSLPSEALPSIKEFFYKKLPEKQACDKVVYEEIQLIFEKQEAGRIYNNLRMRFPAIRTFAGEALEVCYYLAKNTVSVFDEIIPPTGKTQAVVFDFDGTLTSRKVNMTTWESIWTKLGYDVKLCQELHTKFNRGEISHDKWCKLTEEYFRDRHLHRSMVEEISSKIKLLKGTKKTFQELYQRDIKIYIVSGSIMTVIRSVIRPIYQYVDGIKANELRFGENGILKEIIGTKYDFEGKASYISEIAEELKISPRDILFVGNSFNDQFAYISGARTICINPQSTDITNVEMWNRCIIECRDLTEILLFLEYSL